MAQENSGKVLRIEHAKLLRELLNHYFKHIKVEYFENPAYAKLGETVYKKKLLPVDQAKKIINKYYEILTDANLRKRTELSVLTNEELKFIYEVALDAQKEFKYQFFNIKHETPENKASIEEFEKWYTQLSKVIAEAFKNID